MKDHMPERKYPKMTGSESFAPQEVMDNEARIHDTEDKDARDYKDAVARLTPQEQARYRQLSSRLTPLSPDEMKEYYRIGELIDQFRAK